MSAEPENLREARERRKARGKLSSIELLVGKHPEVEPDLVWALGALRDNKLPQTAILAEFNERLADRGLRPISKGAWSRYAVRKALQFHKMDEVQRISGDLIERLGTDGPDQVTAALAQMIKTTAYHMLEEGKITPKELMEISRALSTAVSAQKVSHEHRRQLEEYVRKATAVIDAFTAEAEQKAADEGGIVDQAALMRRIRTEIYGIFEVGENE
jgi:hypothetical protein